MFHFQQSESTLELLTMSSKPPVNEKANSILNSSTPENRDVLNHHTTSTKLVDQNTIGPSMQQRFQRPLSTYTSLGSPIHRSTTCILNAPRKMSIGSDAPSTPLSNTLTGRPRSNSHSTVMSKIPALILPLQQVIYDDVSYVPPIVEGTTMKSERNLVTPKTYSAMTSKELSDCYQEAIEVVHASERKRTMDLEKEEQNMTADELRQVLKRERARTMKMQVDLQMAILRCNDLLSSHRHHHQQQQNNNKRPVSNVSETDRIQMGLLTRRQKMKD